MSDELREAEARALAELQAEIGRPASETTPIPEVIALYRAAVCATERARIAEAVRGEYVEAEETQHPSDFAYNQALNDVLALLEPTRIEGEK